MNVMTLPQDDREGKYLLTQAGRQQSAWNIIFGRQYLWPYKMEGSEADK